MSNEVDLLACPFCRGKAKCHQDERRGFAIRCVVCLSGTDFYSTAGIAITRWNSRAIDLPALWNDLTTVNDATRKIFSQWFSFYEKHFRGPGIAISAADQMAFMEIAQPILMGLCGRTAALRATKPAAQAGAFAITDEIVNYIAQYGGRCRDCADENGVCLGSGLPCGGKEKAIRHVLTALNYGLQHKFIALGAVDAGPDYDIRLHENILDQMGATKSDGDVEGHALSTALAPQASASADAAVHPAGIKPGPSDTPSDAKITENIGRWLSAALDDPKVCAEMKADIRAWMEAGEPNVQPSSDAGDEPVAYTNEAQLGFLKDPAYAEIPMAMWARRKDAVHDVALYRGPTGSDAVREMREALQNSCERLQSFLDTFGDLGDCVTQADIDDWRALPSHGGEKAGGR